MSEVTLNKESFKKRLSHIRKHISGPLLAILGKSEDVEISNMNSAIFLYLLGYELPETALLISSTEACAVTSPKKALILEQLGGEIRILVRSKNNSNISEIKKQIERMSREFGVADRENIKGAFCEMIMEDMVCRDATREVLDLMQVKEDKEVENAKRAGKNASTFMQKCIDFVVQEQADTKRITHGELGRRVEDVLYEENGAIEGDQDKVEFTFPPFLQSGCIFDLENLHFNAVENTYVKYDNVLCKIGVRYDGYCAELGRTILFNPEQDMADDLNLLYELQRDIAELIRPGASVEVVRGKVEDMFREKGLGGRINTGFLYSTGLYHKEEIVRDVFESGMVLVINLEIKNGARIVNLADTFHLSDKLQCITSGPAQREESVADKTLYSQPVMVRTDKKTIGIRVRKRDQDLEKNIRRTEHQKELLDKLIEEMKAYHRDAKQEDGDKGEEEVVYIPYKKEALVPRKPKIAVDRKGEAVIVPIFDYCVPFHVSMIKNMSKTEEGDRVVLRINFSQKESLKSVGTQRSLDTLKSISYVASTHFIEEIFNQITEMKKSFQEKVSLQAQNQGIVEQEALREARGRRVVLADVLMRTDARAGVRKSAASHLELHENGLRFGAQPVELLASNIKHAFFQEATVEQRAILHFHLVNPLIVGKKTYNLQFYKEVGMSMTHDTLKNRNDEYMEMVLEKEFEDRRSAINREFKLFIEHIEENLAIKVEVPYVDKSFYGVPFRESVLIHPTNECLVSLVDAPFLVVTLSEIEIINFERVVYGVKTSDMIIVLKDKKRPPISILSIDSSCISDLKDFFDSKNVVFLETKVNIQWNNLLKTIMQDPLAFYESNAWYDLISPEAEENSESSTDVETEYTSIESDFDTEDESDDDVSEEFEGEEDEDFSDEEDYYDSEDDEDEDESYEDYEYPRKKKK